MSLRKYLTSKTFFIQSLIALSIIFAIGYLFMHWLSYTTNHGQEIVVPNLAKLTEEQVDEKLSDLNLDYVVLDSVDYHSDFPKYSVVEQEPNAGMKVKENRKIYIKMNSAGFKLVVVPNLIQKTYRQAIPTLTSLGFQEGAKIYKPHIGKDMVLEMRYNGKVLKPGEKILKQSKIDLVLGDGKINFEDSEVVTPIDSTSETTENEQ